MIACRTSRAETGMSLRSWSLPEGRFAEAGHGERLTSYRAQGGGRSLVHWSCGEPGQFRAGSWRIDAGGPVLLVLPGGVDYEVRKEPSPSADWWLVGLGESFGQDPYSAPLGHPAFAAFVAVRRLMERRADVMECEEAVERLRQAVLPAPSLLTPCRRAAWLARDLMHLRHGEALTLLELSREAGLSRAHLVRSFRAEFGIPCAAYLREVRLQAARTRLRQGMPAVRAAFESGYQSLPSFGHAYRRRFGIPPGSDRNEPLR